MEKTKSVLRAHTLVEGEGQQANECTLWKMLWRNIQWEMELKMGWSGKSVSDKKMSEQGCKRIYGLSLTGETAPNRKALEQERNFCHSFLFQFLIEI